MNEKIGARSNFERVMEMPLLHTNQKVSEMRFPCVSFAWAEKLSGAYLTPQQMVRLIERIREAKSLTQEDLGKATERSRTNISDMLRKPEARVESLKEVLSMLTGLEFTETRHCIE